MREQVIQEVLNKKLIAIVRGQSKEAMEGLATALYEGGISMMEITFAQQKPETFKDTAFAISFLKSTFSGRMRIGAGTVLTLDQLKMAHDAGAEYIISPNTDEELIRETRRRNLVSMPGAMTPSEVMKAHNAGADFVKLFPAGELGTGYIKAIRAPISHVKLLGVGGINEGNAESFLKAGCVGLGIGGELVNSAWIADGRFDLITEKARAFAKVVGA